MHRIANILSKGKSVFLIGAVLFAVLIMVSLYMVRDFLSFSNRDVFNNRSSTKDGQAGQEMLNSAQKKSLFDYALVVTNNPFGLKAEGFSPLTNTKKPAGVVTIKLRLLGTIAGNKGTGYAVIEDDKGTQEVFKTGDEVFKMAVLEKVLPDSVIFKDGSKISLAEIPTGLTPPTQQTAFALPVPNAPTISGASDNFIRPAATNSYVLDARKVQDALDNPKALMTEARLQPRYNNGRQEGFMLQEVKSGGIYDQLGLKNGDVLLSVNRYDITNPETGLQAFTALRGVNDLQLDILRGGTKVTLNYQMR